MARNHLLQSRGARYGAYATVYTIVIVAVLGAINFLANRYDKSYDATANKQYSLADQSIKIVRTLPRDVTITYFDKATQFPVARDLLDRYANLSPKLHIVYVDPDKKPQIAKAAGIRTYGSIVVDSGTKKEEAKSLSEEEVTGALIRSLKSGQHVACFVTGSGEASIDDTSGRGGLGSAKEALEKNNYKVQSLNLLQTAARNAAPAAPGAAPTPGKIAVPDDCTLLVVAGPQHDYVQPEADAIKAYVERAARLCSCSIRRSPPARIPSMTTPRSMPSSPAGASPSIRISPSTSPASARSSASAKLCRSSPATSRTPSPARSRTPPPPSRSPVRWTSRTAIRRPSRSSSLLARTATPPPASAPAKSASTRKRTRRVRSCSPPPALTTAPPRGASSWSAARSGSVTISSASTATATSSSTW